MIIQLLNRQMIMMVLSASSRIVAPGPDPGVRQSRGQKISKPEDLAIISPSSFAVTIESMDCYDAVNM